MGLLESYTLSELETESGFDKRTIAYYISEGLLPKVGRRGPRTRYPLDFLERLMFIRRVRDMQDDGKLRAVMLTEIRDVIDQLTADEISAAARKGSSVRWIREVCEKFGLAASESGIINNTERTTQLEMVDSNGVCENSVKEKGIVVFDKAAWKKETLCQMEHAVAT